MVGHAGRPLGPPRVIRPTAITGPARGNPRLPRRYNTTVTVALGCPTPALFAASTR